MSARTKLAVLAGLAVLALTSTAIAAPDGAIVVLEFQDTRERKVVMGASDQGVVFVGEDLGNFRAFRSRGLSGRDFLWVADIDGDRENEYAFGGDPSFVLDQGGDPLFGILGGCDDFYVGDMVDDSNVEVFCRKGNTLSTWFYDGQFLWEYSQTGRRISGCNADDVDSDEQLEFACSTNDGVVLLIDLGNEETVQEVPEDPTETQASDPFERYAADATAIFQGNTTFDIDGDGDRDDKLMFNDGSLTMLDGSGASLGSVDLPESELFSATVGDLNGDGTPEVFVGGVGKIYVISASGELQATVEARPRSLDRDGRVTIASAHANGLEESDDSAVQAVVEGGMTAIRRCYTRRMGNDQFVRVGNMMFELTIDGRGRVSNAQKIHSSIRNDELESCVSGALDDLRFSSPSNGSGSVSVRLAFDFVDQ